MPLTITRDQIATAMGVNVDTVTRRLKGVPRSRDGSTYLLAAVLPRANPDHMPALFAAATDDSALYVGSGAVTMAIASILDASLTPEACHRYQRIRASMVAGLTSARGGAAYLPLIEILQQKALLHSEILRHVILATPCIIDFSAFAPAFCLVNGAYEPEGIAA